MLRPEPRETGFLEGYVVVVAQGVEPDDGVAALEEARRGVISDEPGSAGDEDLGHGEEDTIARAETGNGKLGTRGLGTRREPSTA